MRSIAGCRRAMIAFAFLPLANCSTVYDATVDPGQTVPVESVFKSLRCELMTFLVANRLRGIQFEAQKSILGYDEARARYAYLGVDPTKYGALQVDLKTIDTLGLTVGLDWKENIDKFGRFHDWHLGPSLNATKTYTRTSVFALPQDGILGPSRRNDALVPRFEANPDSSDRDFFCYVGRSNVPSPTYDLAGAEALVAHQIPEIENFERIYVVEIGRTLAQWLEQYVSAEMSKSYLAEGDYMESIYAGQLQFSFGLELKPGIDFKYTMIATVINPYVPDLNVSRDNTGTFTAYLNTTQAAFAIGGKGANASIDQPPKPLEMWGPGQITRPGQQPGQGPRGRPPAPPGGARSQIQAPVQRGPGGHLDYPLPLITLPSPGQ